MYVLLYFVYFIACFIGPKSHKYPTQIYQQQGTAYGLDKFPQPSVQQPDYSQNLSYAQSNYYG